MNYIDVLNDNKNSMTMQNYGTESSATSAVMPMRGGGWLFDGGCGDLALKAAREREFAAMAFLINNGKVSDFGDQDEDKKTLLHYIAANYDDIPNAQNLLMKILSSGDVKSFVHIQDKNGNTPAAIALS